MLSTKTELGITIIEPVIGLSGAPDGGITVVSSFNSLESNSSESIQGHPGPGVPLATPGNVGHESGELPSGLSPHPSLSKSDH